MARLPRKCDDLFWVQVMHGLNVPWMFHFEFWLLGVRLINDVLVNVNISATRCVVQVQIQRLVPSSEVITN